MENLRIRGKKPLKGSVRIGGSKNAVLPIMAACLLSEETSVLTNVPDISDVHSFAELIREIGAKVEFSKNTLTITPGKIKRKFDLAKDLVCRMRASILLAGPLLARNREVNMPYPGGCVLGKRSVGSHVLGLQRLGAEIVNIESRFHLKAKKLQSDVVILPEFSVTATENVIMAASLIPKTTQIRIAACEPHVQDLCHFLVKMGVKIDGIGTHTITVKGKERLRGANHQVVSDYLQAGTYLLAGIVTGGEVTVTGIDPEHLDIFFEKLEEIGVPFERGRSSATVFPAKNLMPIESFKTGVHPNFPTDLQAPFVVALTQANGVSKVFETLFEGRFQYLYELEKMGARVELLNPHQAMIIGASKLKGVPVSSCDIRAGAAMVLAGLAAEGETLITNVKYIDRGYENLESNLRKLGADIERVDVNIEHTEV